MNKKIFVVAAISLFFLLAGKSSADGRVWQDHAAPFTFLFGNHIDTHQETRLITNGRKEGTLRGWFYVFDSGDTLDDGTPILKHCTKPEHYAAGCVAGWRLDAVPCIAEVNDCRAMFLYHYHDHPIWLLGAHIDKSGGLRGSRQAIPQPDSYTHFHWLTEELSDFPSSLADVEALYRVNIEVPEPCNVAMASELTPGVECPGYFLQISALEPFRYKEWAFHHGGENLILRRGTDNKTHLNLLTSYRSLPPGVLPGEYGE